jgi:hypothetical protein
MRRFAGAVGLCLISFAAGQAPAQPVEEPAKATKPRVYALLAAVGDQFTVVSEVSRTGTHLSPYVRRTDQIPNDVLNRLALHSLDQAIARIDPESKRIYLALPAISMNGVAPSERGSVALSRIRALLDKMQQRLDWDRIVIVTPAYRALELDGLGTKQQGFGMFAETQCQGSCGGPRSQDQVRALASEPSDGIDAITSEDKPIKARTFLAPFSYLEVWVLDPKTLAVLDRQQGFDSQKLAEPAERPLDVAGDAGQRYLAMRIASLIDLSLGEAVKRSEINARRGSVEIGTVKEVKPESEPAKKSDGEPKLPE